MLQFLMETNTTFIVALTKSDKLNKTQYREALAERSSEIAQYGAVAIIPFSAKTGEGADPSAPVAINADGSTYYKTRAVPFAETVVKELDDMLVKRRNIHYEITPMVEDAPMVGAGIAAML